MLKVLLNQKVPVTRESYLRVILEGEEPEEPFNAEFEEELPPALRLYPPTE